MKQVVYARVTLFEQGFGLMHIIALCTVTTILDIRYVRTCVYIVFCTAVQREKCIFNDVKNEFKLVYSKHMDIMKACNFTGDF